MKDLLPDTHLLLWSAEQNPRLPVAADAMLNDPHNRVFFSVASLWEIAIKSGLSRSDFVVDPTDLANGLLAHGYIELPVRRAHALAVCTLPRIHKDPFDRMLVAQATVEGLTLLTVDAEIAKYPGPIHKF